MTVEPGFGGQAFIPPMLRKIEKTRKLLGDEVDIEVDGGIKDETIRDAKNAGANVFVVGSYIFKAEDKPARVNGLRERLAD
jgi:ribulose-phosphate 3-epimerase